ncbi:phage tail assembly protein [Cloacibacillus porcorum]|uniref:phage tail assembly protein n=1 Tax=Cloacibacillus porcorum TaxID=1197717 RepID=UPI0026716916|nr:phage tail assembly protein [Cloacibacillus porcorum]
MKIMLSKEFVFEGKTYSEVDLDLENLTGADLEAAERIAISEGGGLGNFAELCKPFQAAVAARAAKLPLEFFHNLPAKDYSLITLSVGNFLLK